LSAEVAVANARPESLRTENRLRVARHRLQLLLAQEEEVDVAGVLPVEIGTYPQFEATLAEALSHRPELDELARLREINRALVSITRAQGKPRLDLDARWGRHWLSVRDTTAAGAAWTVGVTMSFPFFDGGRTKGRVRQAESDLARAALDETRLREAIGLQVRTAVDAVREAGEIGRALSGTVAQAERLLYMAEQGYQLGVKTHLEVEDAVFNLTAARAELAKAQRDHRVAVVEVSWAAGTVATP
jgi:outer membrane protein TolC